MTPHPFLPGLEPAPARLCPLPVPASEGCDVLRTYPQVQPADIARHGKHIGHAGELLVDSLFARLGLTSFEMGDGYPFDRALWLDGKIVRVQIKTRAVQRHRDDYIFEIRKGYHNSPLGLRGYDAGEFDMLALVVLAENVVRFTADTSQRHTVRQSEIARLRSHPHETLDHALEQLGFPAPMPAEAFDDGDRP